MNFASPADQQTDLPVDVAGKKAKLPGQFRGNDLFRRNVFAIQSFQLFNLAGTKPGCISRKFMNGFSPLRPQPTAYLNLCGLTFLSILSKNVDQLLVRKEETSFLGEVLPQLGQEIPA